MRTAPMILAVLLGVVCLSSGCFQTAEEAPFPTELRVDVSASDPPVVVRPDEPMDVSIDLNPIWELDLQGTPLGEVPEGCRESAFVCRIDDTTERRCLEVIPDHNLHWLELPPLDPALEGDFVVEIECLLNGFRGMRSDQSTAQEHRLEIRLEGSSGEVVPISIAANGSVTLPETRPRQTAEFKRYRINRLQLVREGKIYKVIINDGIASADRLPDMSPIEKIQLGMVAGIPCTQEGEDFPSRLFSVKLTQ